MKTLIIAAIAATTVGPAMANISADAAIQTAEDSHCQRLYDIGWDNMDLSEKISYVIECKSQGWD